MIIKIEDLPNGKAIKHITINISFDEDSPPSTKVKQDYTESKATTLPHVILSSEGITKNSSPSSIPKEMTDSEF